MQISETVRCYLRSRNDCVPYGNYLLSENTEQHTHTHKEHP